MAKQEKANYIKRERRALKSQTEASFALGGERIRPPPPPPPPHPTVTPARIGEPNGVHAFCLPVALPSPVGISLGKELSIRPPLIPPPQQTSR